MEIEECLRIYSVDSGSSYLTDNIDRIIRIDNDGNIAKPSHILRPYNDNFHDHNSPFTIGDIIHEVLITTGSDLIDIFHKSRARNVIEVSEIKKNKFIDYVSKRKRELTDSNPLKEEILAYYSGRISFARAELEKETEKLVAPLRDKFLTISRMLNKQLNFELKDLPGYISTLEFIKKEKK